MRGGRADGPASSAAAPPRGDRTLVGAGTRGRQGRQGGGAQASNRFSSASPLRIQNAVSTLSAPLRFASDDGSALGLAVAVGPLVDWLVVVDVAAASESPTITTPDMPGWR